MSQTFHFLYEKMILLCVKFDSVKVTNYGMHKHEYFVNIRHHKLLMIKVFTY